MEKENIPYSVDEPKEINSKNVIYYSEHYKMLKGAEGEAIRTKAKKFVELGLIEYSKEHKCYLCKGNLRTYHIIWDKTKQRYKEDGRRGEFECSCQYNQKTFKMCSHILALYMQFRIWDWQKKEKLIKEGNFK